jgi:YggT family protein
MSQSLLFILRVATDIFVLILLVRALLQLVQADFYNPISQTVFKICAPVVEPLRKILPTVGRLNLAAVVAALGVQWAFYVIILTVSGQLSPQVFAYLAVAAFDVLSALVEIYFWGIFILVISSWIGTTNHPTVRLVGQIVEPYMRPFRNLIPPIGMIDISPMVAIFALMLIQSRLLPMIGGLIKPMLG